jgi:hypothetical protein
LKNLLSFIFKKKSTSEIEQINIVALYHTSQQPRFGHKHLLPTKFYFRLLFSKYTNKFKKAKSTKTCTRFLESFDLATIHHFQSEGIDNISSTWLKQIFFYSKEINKMLKRVLWMDIPSLIENGVSPKLNFGSLVGLSSFW